MKIMKQSISIVAAAAALCTSGCVKLWQDNLDIKTYMMDVNRDLPTAEKPLADKLWIDSVVVLPPGNSRNLILKESDVEYSMSYYSELLMSPSENFRNIFYTWIAGSGLFRDVTMADRAAMTHRLTVSVLSFHEDLVEKKAVLKIKVTLFDEHSRELSVLSSSEYEQRVEVDGTSIDALIRAYNQAIYTILSECENDLAAALQK
ncbi:ABC-type transport auxiliary lipoprotein family protein [Pontiellaceae bacterium B12219]|nr:ABC-type transport auxiliary lipoprotein family protein [Pontiellaceae bacterium B12219]